eukprot:jgi/Tetstr1/433510/TSEL_022780.t1
MRWSGSAYYFCKLTGAFTDDYYLRAPPATTSPASSLPARKPTRRFLRNNRWRGERIPPYIDDSLFLADSREAACAMRTRIDDLLDRLSLIRKPKKEHREPTHVGERPD